MNKIHDNLSLSSKVPFHSTEGMNWEKEFDKRFPSPPLHIVTENKRGAVGDDRGNVFFDDPKWHELKSFISSLLKAGRLSTLQEVREKVKELTQKLYEKNAFLQHRNEFNEIYNAAIADALSFIDKLEGKV